jgi:hypothetical protein
MAIYKIFPTQDSTLYSIHPEMNTGLDEIIEASLEVGNIGTPAPQTSRFLIKFDSTEISDILNTKISGSQWQSNLRCFAANVTALNSDTNIEVYPISQSWNMGTGRYLSIPEVQNGVSWIWRDYQGGNKWATSSFAPGTTGSYSSSVTPGGATWYVTQSLSGSQTFSFYSSVDLNINVTNIVKAWYSSSIENNGFIVKQQNEFINNEDVQPKIKYFSIDTHTIYPPCLEFRWNDTTFNTGSSTLTNISVTPFVVTIGENPGTFYLDSVNKFRVYSRPEYPDRVFQTASYFTQNYYLPDTSYYAIKDLDTNEYVVDFDSTYTKLSKDEKSSFFTLYMSGLEPERYYKILIKTIVSGSTFILDDDYYFKIING